MCRRGTVAPSTAAAGQRRRLPPEGGGRVGAVLAELGLPPGQHERLVRLVTAAADAEAAAVRAERDDLKARVTAAERDAERLRAELVGLRGRKGAVARLRRKRRGRWTADV